MTAEVERAKKYCQVIRAICHTQVGKVKIGQKKAHIKEIQAPPLVLVERRTVWAEDWGTWRAEEDPC